MPKPSRRYVVEPWNTPDSLHGHFERVRRDLHEAGFHALTQCRRADVDRDGSVGLEHEARILLRSGGAALDVAADSEAVVAAVDQLALQFRLLGPADFG